VWPSGGTWALGVSYDAGVKASAPIRPRKRLGQHWLTDRAALRRIADGALVTDEETVIEVGAGTGLLTGFLAERARRLIAVEVDEGLANRLDERFAGDARVAVLRRDVLDATPEELLVAGGGRVPYVVVGNLPYFIGTAIVRRFLEATVRPRRLIVTLQAEVAESIAAPPGRMSYLSVEMQTRASAKVLFYLPPKAFKPPPKVRSAVVRLDVLETSDAEVDDREAFLALVRAGFAAPRKRLRNSLAIGLRVPASEASAILGDAGVDADQRSAGLTLLDWQSVYFAWRSMEQGEMGSGK
jgi:16S rRNA (adenine1518-N6/adenine1519-N6)-dimethyltransferase